MILVNSCKSLLDQGAIITKEKFAQILALVPPAVLESNYLTKITEMFRNDSEININD